MKKSVSTVIRAITVLLTLSMMVGFAPTATITAFAAGGVWAGDGLTEDTAYEIADADDLAELAEQVNAGESYADSFFRLTADVDLTDWLTANGGSEGWTPIGTFDTPFSGVFDGGGHTISGLWINRQSGQLDHGLFGAVEGGTLKNLRAETSGEGVVARFTAAVLAGYVRNSEVLNCHATGSVTAADTAGGLIGTSDNSVVEISGFTGSVEGREKAGGLIGSVNFDGTIRNCYVVGNVSAVVAVEEGGAGGLIGWGSNGLTVQSCYASVAVQGIQNAGGLAGVSYGTFTDSFWDMDQPQTVDGTEREPSEKTGVGSNASAAGVSGKTGDELRRPSTFAGWDFESVWVMAEGASYPYLRGGVHPDYYLDGQQGSWEDNSFILLNSDNPELVILAGAGPETPVSIHAQPLAAGSYVTIEGQPGVNYENIYISVNGANVTLNLKDLEITAPENQNGILISDSIMPDGSAATIHTTGKCVIRGGGNSGQTVTGNAIDSRVSVILEGDPIELYGGDCSNQNGGAGYGVNSFGNVTLLSDAVIRGGNGNRAAYGIFAHDAVTIEENITVDARGGDGYYTGGGIQVGGDIVISGGRLTASGGTGETGTYGLSANGKISISGDSVVTVDTGKLVPGAVSYGYAIQAHGGAAITGTAEVIATGHHGGYGIVTNSGKIDISGDAKVTATGGDASTQGGGLALYTFSDEGISISDRAQVVLQGGASTNAAGEGVDIDGGHAVSLRGNGDFVINGGSLMASAGNSAHGSGGRVIYTDNDANIRFLGGSAELRGGDGYTYGGHGVFTQNGDIEVAGMDRFSATGGDGETEGGGVGVRAFGEVNEDGTWYVRGNTVAIGGSRDIYIRGGMGSQANGQRASVMAGKVKITGGNVGEILSEKDAPDFHVQNSNGTDVYMLCADTQPLAPKAMFQAAVTDKNDQYTYDSPSLDDGIAYLWLPKGTQTVSAAGYGSGSISVKPDNTSSVTLYNEFDFTIDYTDGSKVRQTGSVTARLGDSVSLTAPQGYALANGVASSIVVDDAFLAGGAQNGCTVTVNGKAITVEVPVKAQSNGNNNQKSSGNGGPTYIYPSGLNEEWIELPFISGYSDGTFRPDNGSSRAEIAQTLYRLYGKGNAADLNRLDSFSDIDAAHWAANAVAWAAGQGYIHGDQDGTVRPDETITRAELAVVLQRVAAKKGLATSAGATQSMLTDIDGHWAYEAIELLAGMNVLQGYTDGTFRPENTVSRAEAVTMLSRLLGRGNTFTPDKAFSDVGPGHWAYSSIMNAANGLKK